jgi:phosphate transport system protein
MSRMIDAGLEQQSVLLVKMGELTYETLDMSIRGYLKAKSVHPEVREMSDMLVSMADEVEDDAFQLIARFQPVASDLRAIKSYMKIGNDFARYGRYALDISSINEQFDGLKECDVWAQKYLEEMCEKVLSMVKSSIDALRKLDVNLAKSVAQTEQEVDKMYFEFLTQLIEDKKAKSKCLVSAALMNRYLERIADHATYVCESVVYISTGEKITLR